MKKFLKLFLFYLCSFYFIECIYKIFAFGNISPISYVYTFLLTSFISFIFTLISVYTNNKVSVKLMPILFLTATIIYSSEYMFYKIFDTTFSVYSLNLANQALDFRKILYSSIKEEVLPLALMLIPFVTFMIFKKKILYRDNFENASLYLTIGLFFYAVMAGFIFYNKNDDYSAYALLFETQAPTASINKIGVLTTFYLDIERKLSSFNSELKVGLNINDKKDLGITKKEVEYNKLDLDFNKDTNNSVHAELNSYFSSLENSNKNEYTGIFKGKNLIYILAEGFNSIAVSKDITPTLYKLVNDGLYFSNYYSPVFMSTTGGEFQFSLSMIPTQKSLNSWKKGTAYLPYTIGNIFNNQKYYTSAFHNWTYSYYTRNKTMPIMGFNNYVGCGNGLEEKMNCKNWPPSDIDMINATTDYYMNEDNFAIYYITVSGHAEYNFGGNNIARKNKELTDDLEYSESARAYLSTQIELDKALEALIEKLNDAKLLDDTVIVLSGDHYPYTLNLDTINELSDYQRDSTFEVNHSNLIIYNKDLKKQKIDTLASSIDVLPTILNMFGIEYDSRLLEGTDIFSNHDSLVVFSDNSWISNKGRYLSKTGKFIPNNDDETIDDEYIRYINNQVSNKLYVTEKVLESDYYRYLLS